MEGQCCLTSVAHATPTFSICICLVDLREYRIGKEVKKKFRGHEVFEDTHFMSQHDKLCHARRWTCLSYGIPYKTIHTRQSW